VKLAMIHFPSFSVNLIHKQCINIPPLLYLYQDRSREEVNLCEKEKESIIASKDNEIQEMKIKMDQMTREFGDMLKETLEKMSERIEITR
jgi:hypothetical protein